MIHRLKTERRHFEAIRAGRKTFELRRDDREPPFEAGDVVVLLEYARNQATGRVEARPIVGVLRPSGCTGALANSLAPGFAILGLGDEATSVSEHVE